MEWMGWLDLKVSCCDDVGISTEKAEFSGFFSGNMTGFRICSRKLRGQDI
jgi:hypothetical protein